MSTPAPDNSSETNRLLHAAAEGRADGWDALLGKHRARLRRMVSLRLDRRMRGAVDPSDIVRQACADAAAHRAEYLQAPAESFFLWLRRLAGSRLNDLQRLRLGEPPTAGRDLSLRRGPPPAATSFAIAAQLLGQAAQPNQAEIRAQRLGRLEDALNAMDPVEREVLALRHFEQLTNAETAAVLELPEGDASRLYIRSLKRLKEILSSAAG
jgi:RNA polymerase sigma-70 factor (ECF subfamily)